MNRTTLDMLFDASRKNEGMTPNEVHRTVDAAADRTGRGIGIIRPAFLIGTLLIVATTLLLTDPFGSEQVTTPHATEAGIVSEQTAASASMESREADSEATTTSASNNRDRTSSLALRTLLPRSSDGSVTTAADDGWGYRWQVGDHFVYSSRYQITNHDNPDWSDDEPWTAVIDVTDRAPNGDLTFNLDVTNEKGNSEGIMWATIDRHGNMLDGDMIVDPELPEWLARIDEPDFGGGARRLPSSRVAYYVERFIPRWYRRDRFRDRRLSFDSVRFDTASYREAPDYDDPSIHGDTIGSSIFYSSAKSRGILPPEDVQPDTSSLEQSISDRGGANIFTFSAVSVPIADPGKDSARDEARRLERERIERERRENPEIERTDERHDVRILEVNGKRTSWVDSWSRLTTGVSEFEKQHLFSDTLEFRASDGVLIRSVSAGTTRGPRGMNADWVHTVRLVEERVGRREDRVGLGRKSAKIRIGLLLRSRGFPDRGTSHVDPRMPQDRSRADPTSESTS